MGLTFLDLPDVRGGIERELQQIAQRTGLPADIIAGFTRGGRAVPTTRTRTSHAYTLRTARGHIIGAVFRTSVRQTREVDYEYEISKNGTGQPVALVPQVMTAQTFSIDRFDLYEEIMEEVLGTRELEVLTDQARGYRLRETWRSPTSILNSQNRLYEYGPCWFTDLGRDVEATNDRIVRASAQLVWLRRRPLA